nr:PT domain-containing protein [Burkholderia savannae]
MHGAARRAGPRERHGRLRCARRTDERTNGRTDEPTNQRTNGPTDQRTNGPTDQRTNGPTDQRTNGPTGQRANGPTGQRAKGRTSERTAGPGRPRPRMRAATNDLACDGAVVAAGSISCADLDKSTQIFSKIDTAECNEK